MVLVGVGKNVDKVKDVIMAKILNKKSSKIFVATMVLLIIIKMLKGYNIPFWGFIFWGILLVGFLVGLFVAEKE